MRWLKQMWPEIKLELEKIFLITLTGTISLGFLAFYPGWGGLMLAVTTPLYVFAAWLELRS